MTGALSVPVGQVDLERRAVHRADGGRERLTELEARVLRYLAELPGQVVSREQLLERVWGYDPAVLTRACDTTIARLRTKIELDPAAPEALLTIRGVGYTLVDPAAPAPSAPEPEPTEAEERQIPLGERRLDLRRARVDTPDGPISLTGNELAVLEALLAAEGAPIDRDVLQRRIWGSASGRPIDNAVLRIRRKIEPDPRRPRFLVTTALGYRLELGQEAAPEPRRAALSPLPAEVDARFGRGTEVEAAVERLRAGDRLVTLVGPGGVGKTRLALAIARRMAEERPVAWVDLSPARSVDRVLAALAGALRVQLGDGDPLALLGQAMRSAGPLVVVVDNVEQLGPEAIQALVSLLDPAPELSWLATSRVPLKVRAERRLPIGPLAHADAVALFLDRSARALGPDELAPLDLLVQDLEHLPLALELAAARTALLRVPELRARTADRLGVLAVADPSRPARHRSLQASLDASLELLSPGARSALSELTVFGGSFALGTAEEVVAPLGGAWVVDLVEELVDANLVRRDPESGRLSLFALVREHAADLLDPGDRDRAERRHGRALAALAPPELLDALDAPGGLERRAALALELEDLLLAAERAIFRADPAVAVDTLAGAWEVLESRGPYALVSSHVDPLLALPMEDDLRVRALLLAGRVHATEGRLDLADERLSEAARLAARLGSARLGVEAHVGLSRVRLTQWKPALAEADANVALTLARTLDAPILAARAMGVLGAALRALYQIEPARQVLATAADLAADHGATRCEAEVRRALGIALAAGDAPFARALRLARDLGDRRLEALVLLDGAAMARQRGAVVWERLATLAEQFRSIGDSASELRAHVHAFTDLLVLEEVGRAEQVLARIRELTLAIRADWAQDLLQMYEGQLARVQGRLDEARRHLEEAIAISRRRGHHSREAVALDLYARLLAEMGDPAGAERARSEVLGVMESSGNRLGALTARFRLAQSAVDRGDPVAARGWIDPGLARAREGGFAELEIGFLFLLARLAVGDGAHDQVRGLMVTAEARVRELGPRFRVNFLVSAAELDLDLGDPGRAAARLDEADRIVAAEIPAGYKESDRAALRARSRIAG